MSNVTPPTPVSIESKTLHAARALGILLIRSARNALTGLAIAAGGGLLIVIGLSAQLPPVAGLGGVAIFVALVVLIFGGIAAVIAADAELRKSE